MAAPRKCAHNGPRYRTRNSWQCAICVKERATRAYEVRIGGVPPQRPGRQAAKMARAAGRVTYLGNPCPQHGMVERYTLGGTCVQCGLARDRRRHIERRVGFRRPAWADELAMLAIYSRGRESGLHVDHIVPLRSPLVSGLDWELNLQLLPASDNIRKGNRHWPDMP